MGITTRRIVGWSLLALLILGLYAGMGLLADSHGIGWRQFTCGLILLLLGVAAVGCLLCVAIHLISEDK